MSGTTIKGYEMAFEIEGVKVAGIGTCKYTPGAKEEMDDTEFGDTTEKIVPGMRKRGSISFSGLAKLSNAEQEKLKRAQVNGTNITSCAMRVASSLAYQPCITTGYFSPLSTTGNLTQPGYINITSWDIDGEKNSLAKINFTGVVSGDFVEAAV